MTSDEITRKWDRRRRKWRRIHWAFSVLLAVETLGLGTYANPKADLWMIAVVVCALFWSVLPFLIHIFYLEVVYDRCERDEQDTLMKSTPGAYRTMMSSLHRCQYCFGRHTSLEEMETVHLSLITSPILSRREVAPLSETIELARAIRAVQKWK